MKKIVSDTMYFKLLCKIFILKTMSGNSTCTPLKWLVLVSNCYSGIIDKKTHFQFNTAIICQISGINVEYLLSSMYTLKIQGSCT